MSRPARGVRIETRLARTDPEAARVAPRPGRADRNAMMLDNIIQRGGSRPARGVRIETPRDGV